MTGGEIGGDKSSELLLSDGKYWCQLPGFSDYKYAHTQSGLIACGGGGVTCIDLGTCNGTSCIKFDEGQWKNSHKLLYQRDHHSSWYSPQHGTILIGGDYTTESTTEMLKDNGNSQKSFSLKYRA